MSIYHQQTRRPLPSNRMPSHPRASPATPPLALSGNTAVPLPPPPRRHGNQFKKIADRSRAIAHHHHQSIRFGPLRPVKDVECDCPGGKWRVSASTRPAAVWGIVLHCSAGRVRVLCRIERSHPGTLCGSVLPFHDSGSPTQQESFPGVMQWSQRADSHHPQPRNLHQRRSAETHNPGSDGSKARKKTTGGEEGQMGGRRETGVSPHSRRRQD